MDSGFYVCRRGAHKQKYLATVQFRVYRSLTIRRWSPNAEGGEGSLFLSHPTLSKAAKPLKPISFLIPWFSSLFQVCSCSKSRARQGQVRSGPGTGAGQGRTGEGPLGAKGRASTPPPKIPNGAASRNGAKEPKPSPRAASAFCPLYFFSFFSFLRVPDSSGSFLGGSGLQLHVSHGGLR